MTDIEKIARIICEDIVPSGYSPDTIESGKLFDLNVESSSPKLFTHLKWEEFIPLAKKIIECLENEN